MHVALVGAEFEENLAVRYLWGALEQAGHRVTFVVFNRAADLERAAAEIVRSGAEVAGFSLVFTYRARQFAALATRARELGYRGHITAGGHFAAFHASELLRDVAAFDSVVLGEGEAPLCALVSALAAPTAEDEPVPSATAIEPLRMVAGLVWRRGAEMVRNAPAVKPADLDRLPVPPRKSPFDDYLGIPITNLLASRGCSHRCAFCSIAAWHELCGGDRLRLRSPEHVAEEMAALYARGVRIFNFHDDNFFPPRRAARLARVRKLGRELERRGLVDIAFAVKARPDVVEEELFAELRKMGLFRVFLGIEAGTERSLAELGRHQRLEDNVAALELLGRLDLHACFNLLLWNPYSTFDDVADNVAFLRRHPRNPMNFCRTEIYAGTPLERTLAAEGRLGGDYWGLDYRIEDERAQRAFEMAYHCFEPRNYGTEGPHHLAMQVDYEHQLASHFFGTDATLRRRVKRFVVDVNVDTVTHLEALLETLRDELPGADEQRAIVAERAALVAAADAAFRLRARSLLGEIRAQAGRTRESHPGWKRRAAAGLAASIAVATACQSCHTETIPVPVEPAPPDGTHPCEEAPMPPDGTNAPQPPGDPLVIVPDDAGTVEGPDASHMAEMAPAPPDAGPPGPDGFSPVGLLPPELRRQALSIVARYVEPQPTELELWFDERGAISRIALRASKIDAAAIRQAGQEIATIVTADRDVRGRRFVLKWTAADLAGAGPSPLPTHPTERVPIPTQPREMAPQPPRPPRPPRPPQHFNEMAPNSTFGQSADRPAAMGDDDVVSPDSTDDAADSAAGSTSKKK